MKLRLLLPLLLVATATTPLLRAESDTPLEKQMQLMARTMRQLSGQIADPAKQQENVTLLGTLRQAAETSRSLDPIKTATVPESQRPAFLAAYRDQMGRLASAFSSAGEAVKAGQFDKAKELVQSVGAIKKEGHSRFKQD